MILFVNDYDGGRHQLSNGSKNTETKLAMVAGSPSGYQREISKGTQILPGMKKQEKKDDGTADWESNISSIPLM